MNEQQTPAALMADLAALQARVTDLEAQLARRGIADEQQRYYAQILESVHDAVVTVDAHFQIVTWNNAAVSIYGWQVAEVLGQHISKVVRHREYLDGTSQEEALQILLRDGVWIGQVVQQDRHGRDLIIDAVVRLIRDEHGMVQGMVAVNRNITARKRAEAAQRESEARYRQMFEGNLAIQLLIEPGTGAIVDANPAACAFYGYPRAHLLSRSLAEINTSSCLLCDQGSQGCSESPAGALRCRHRLASGEVRDVEIHAAPVDVSGQPLIYLIIHDITERTRAEQQLREDEERVRLALEATHMGVWEWWLGSDTLMMSSGLSKLFGTDGPSLFDGGLPDILQYVHPEDRAFVSETLGRATTDGSEVDMEYRLVMDDQSVHWLITKGIVMHDAQDRPERMIGTTTTVTQRKQAELSVRESEANLRAIFESSQQVIILIDVSYQIKAFNSYAQAEYMRFDKHLEIGCSILDYVEPEYLSVFHEHFLEALSGRPCRAEREIAGLQGGEWWEFAYNPIVLDDGQVTGVTWIIQNINERVRAEQRSRDSATRLRLLIEQIPAILWTLDHERQMTWLVGMGLNDAPGAAVFDVLPDRRPEIVSLAAHEQALRGTSAEYEVEWQGHTFQCHVEPFLDGSGMTIGTIGIGLDVSERVRAQQLQEGQRRFFEALATGAPLVQVLDTLALMIENQVSGGLCSVLLLDQTGQMLHITSAPSLPATYVGSVVGVPLGAASGSCGTAAFCDMPVIVSDIATDPRWDGYQTLALSHGLHACWSTPFHDSQGRVLGTFAIYYREPRSPTADALSHLTHAANLAAVAVERTRTESALRDREELYRLITENSGELISLIDQSGNFLYASPSYAHLLGYNPLELSARSLFDLIHLDDLPLLLGDWSQLATRRTIQTTARLRHIDGSWRWVDAHGSVIRRGDALQVVVVGHDVTERMRAEAERRRLEDHLVQAQKMESIGTLTGGIAHDFNNVLSVILGNAQLALLESAPDVLDKSLLVEIEQAAMRGSALTKQLLAFSRRQQLERQVIDLNRTIDDLSLMLTRIIGKDVEIVMSLARDVAAIVADPVQIEQVLLNLVVNARDAMPGGGRLEIATSMLLIDSTQPPYEWAQPGRYVQIVVRDTGVGMTAETRQRVFEPFFTTKAQGKGTGLGLAVVYGIVKQHEGFIHVTSAPESGTIFTILFPAETSGPARPATTTLTDVRGGMETILVVEDEAPLRRLVNATLLQLGYTVLLAEDGQSGVELFQANVDRIDLVILDLVMPRLGGREALAQMRALRPALRALLVSGYDSTAERVPVEQSAAVPLLTKPYRLDVLGRSVRDMLDAPVQAQIDAHDRGI